MESRIEPVWLVVVACLIANIGNLARQDPLALIAPGFIVAVAALSLVLEQRRTANCRSSEEISP